MDVTISINKCDECPFFRDGSGYGDDSCSKMRKPLHNTSIPNECPFRKREIEDSWIKSPDRMGGQYTDEEIRRSTEWR